MSISSPHVSVYRVGICIFCFAYRNDSIFPYTSEVVLKGGVGTGGSFKKHKHFTFMCSSGFCFFLAHHKTPQDSS